MIRLLRVKKKYGNKEAWRLTKVNNNVEFNMVESINFLNTKPKQCMSCINRLSMMHGKLARMKTTRIVARKMVLRPLLLRLFLPLLLLLMLLLMRQSYPLRSLFRKLLPLLLGSLKINSRRFGKAAVMPRETKWPQS